MDQSTLVIVPTEKIVNNILLIRGKKVIIDADLAEIYGVTTMALNQSVKRNISRFPEYYMFQLSEIEKTEVITNCDNLTRLKYSAHLPFVFTEHGVVMLSAVLKSRRAVQVSIFVVNAFIKLREILSSNRDLGHKVELLERDQKNHVKHINTIYEILGKLMDEPIKSKGH